MASDPRFPVSRKKGLEEGRIRDGEMIPRALLGRNSRFTPVFNW